MKASPDPLQDPRFRELLSSLRGLPPPEPSADFVTRVLESMPPPPNHSRRTLSSVWLRVAAALAVLFAAGLWFVRAPAPMATRSPSPLDILMATQRADGGWSADEHRIRPRYDVGVTALALLAMMQVEPSPLAGARADMFREGISYLIAQQRESGSIGFEFPGHACTHYLASKALLAAARLPGAEPSWAQAAERASIRLPSNLQMAKLNAYLARPSDFPVHWAEIGGPATRTALQMLARP